MKFLHNKLFIIGIAVLTLLCFIALYIAVSISATMLSRRSQIVENLPSKKPAAVHETERIININKAKELIFYFNGEKIRGAGAFLAGKDKYFVPIDAILDKLGIKYSYYSSDDILEAVLNGKKMTIRLYKDSFTYGGEEIELSSSPAPARGHVFVPMDLLTHLEGFKTFGYSDKKSAFVNYYNADNAKNDGKIRVFRLVEGKAGISDISGQKQFWDRKGGSYQNEKFYFSGNGLTSVLKSDSKIFIVSYGGKVNPYKVNIDPSATLSVDGRYLYWVDELKRTSYIYDIADDFVKKLGDYFFRIYPGDEDGFLSNGGTVLSDYREGKNYKRVVLTNSGLNDNYAFIEKKGKVLLKGSIDFSPDKRRVLHYRRGEGYYLAGSDGSNIIFIGNGTEARWVTNNKIFLKTDNGMFLLGSDGKKIAKVDNEWRMLGQTPAGDIFYTDGSWLCSETNGTDKRIIELPWFCKYVYAGAVEGPYIAVTGDSTNRVFYMNGKMSINIGKSSLLLKQFNNGGVNSEYSQSIMLSPDKAYFAVLQEENGFIGINLVKKDGTDFRKLVLNRESYSGTVSAKWITGRKMIVYTERQGWIVDFGNTTKVFNWSEKPGSTIAGIVVP